MILILILINNFLYSDLILKIWISKSPSKACIALFWFLILLISHSRLWDVVSWPAAASRDTWSDFSSFRQNLFESFWAAAHSKVCVCRKGPLIELSRRIRGALVRLGPQICRSAARAETTRVNLIHHRGPTWPPVAWTFRTSERTTSLQRPSRQTLLCT